MKYFIIILLTTVTVFAASDRSIFTEIISSKKANQDITITPTGTGDVVLKDYSGVLRASSGTVSAGDVDLAAEITGILPIANGGTNSSAALSNNFVMVSSGGAIAESASITTTELGLLDGISAALVDISSSQTLTNKTLTSPTVGASILLDNQASARFAEQTGNGNNYVTLTAPDSIASNVTWKLPNADGSASTFLQTDGFGNLSFASAAGTNLSVTSQSTTYAASTSDDVILADTSSVGWTLTLPTAVGASGKQLIIEKTTSDTNTLTVAGNGAETIDGSATYLIHTQNEDIKIISDGSNWKILHQGDKNLTLSSVSSGDFTAGTVDISRSGRIVTVSIPVALVFSTSAAPSTASGFIPTWARPATLVRNNTKNAAASLDKDINVLADGTLGFNFSTTQTDSGTDSTITYLVD